MAFHEERDFDGVTIESRPFVPPTAAEISESLRRAREGVPAAPLEDPDVLRVRVARSTLDRAEADLTRLAEAADVAASAGDIAAAHLYRTLAEEAGDKVARARAAWERAMSFLGTFGE